MYYLATRPNRVFSRDQLLDAVWGTERFVTPRSVDVYIRRLREKIETDADHPAFLKTVRGAGYMFESAAQSEEDEDEDSRARKPILATGPDLPGLLLAILAGAWNGPRPAALRTWLGRSLLICCRAAIASLLFSRSSSSRIRAPERVCSAAPPPAISRRSQRDHGDDELAELARRLDATVAHLGQTIHALTDERNRSAAILGSMVEGVAVISGDERILYCNRAFEQILELPQGSSQGQKLVEVVRQSDLVAAVRQVLPGWRTGFGRNRGRHGAAAKLQRDGRAGAAAGAEQRGAGAARHHRAAAPRARAPGFRGQRVARIQDAADGHSGLCGNAAGRRARRYGKPPRFVEIIRDHARRLARLTDDLLKLSRIEAGQSRAGISPGQCARHW